MSLLKNKMYEFFENIKENLNSEKNIGNNAKKRTEERTEEIIDSFKKIDEVSAKTNWDYFEEHKNLFTIDQIIEKSNKIQFKMFKGEVIFRLAILMIGMFFLIPSLISKKISTSIVGFIIIALGIRFIYRSLNSNYFDLLKGIYYKKKEKYLEINNIYAIQLLSKLNSDEDSSSYSYQMNLILKDASRKGVGTYFKRENMIKDAKILSEIFKVKLWNTLPTFEEEESIRNDNILSKEEILNSDEINIYINNSKEELDKVYKKLQWTPLTTHIDLNKMFYTGTKIVFKTSIFFKIPLLLIILYRVFKLFRGFENKELYNMIGESIFIFIVLVFLYIISKKNIFNLVKGIFYGKKGIKIKLEEIYAIQLISCMKSEMYYNYELNLVLKNSKRVNVVTKNLKDEIIKYSKEISKQLEVPSWNAMVK